MKIPPVLARVHHSMAVLWPTHCPRLKTWLCIHKRNHDTTDVVLARHGWMTILTTTAVQTYGVTHCHSDFKEGNMPFLYVSIMLIMFLMKWQRITLKKKPATAREHMLPKMCIHWGHQVRELISCEAGKTVVAKRASPKNSSTTVIRFISVPCNEVWLW